MATKAEQKNLTVKMDVYTRIMLGSIFPERCSIEEYLAFDDIKKKINIEAEEAKEINLQILPDGKTTTWNRKGNEKKDFLLKDSEVKTILNACELASRNKNFPNNPQFFEFYKQLKAFQDSKDKS